MTSSRVLLWFALFLALTTASEISKWENKDFRCIFYCKCQTLEGKNVASCTHKNLTRTPLNGFFLPIGTEVANLSNNRFHILSEYSFNQFYSENMQLHKLLVLNISRNFIQRISPNAFKFIDKLKTLDLSHNNIKILYPKTFLNLNELEELFLDHNDFRSLPEYAFEGLTSLKVLDLSYGQLTHIKWWAFFLSYQPTLLNLKNNSLTTFHSNYIYTPTNLHFKIDLSNNPIKCDCDLQRIFEDNFYYGDIGSIDLTCSDPPNMSSFHFTALMPEDFRGCHDILILPMENRTVVGVANTRTTLSCETIPGPQVKHWSVVSRSDNQTELPDRFAVSQSETWVNLTIFNTQGSDEGEYRCNVSERQHKSMRSASIAFHLKVLKDLTALS